MNLQSSGPRACLIPSSSEVRYLAAAWPRSFNPVWMVECPVVEVHSWQSDLDLLVDLEPGRSLLDHSALLQDLQDLLGRKVGVLTERSIYWLLRRRILREARPL